MTSPAEPCVLMLPTQLPTTSYASAGCLAVFGSLDEAGLLELLGTKTKSALVIFIGRMLEESGLRRPEEQRVCDVAERILATGVRREAFKWFKKDLEQILEEAKPSQAKPSSHRGPDPPDDLSLPPEKHTRMYATAGIT